MAHGSTWHEKSWADRPRPPKQRICLCARKGKWRSRLEIHLLLLRTSVENQRVGRLAPRKQKDDTGRSFHLAGVTKVCSQPRKITELSACEERRGFTCSRIILHGWNSKESSKTFTSEHLQMKKVRNSSVAKSFPSRVTPQ